MPEVEFPTRATAERVERLRRVNEQLARLNWQLARQNARWRERWAWTFGALLVMVAWELWSSVIRWALN